MAAKGYNGLSETQLVAFQTEMEAGAWGAVPCTAAQRRGGGRHELPALTFFKLQVVESIDGLVAAQGADNDVQRCDAPWDDAQRRLVLTVALKALDADPAVRDDAALVQAQLCPGGTTAMTQLEADDEVDYARNQLALARSPALAPAVKRLGLDALLDEVARRTDDLARAVGRGGEARATARWKRVQQAKRACVTAFNLAHEGVAVLAERASDPAEREKYTALAEPFERLLARRVTASAAADATAKDDAAKDATAKDDAAGGEALRPTG